MTSLGLGSHSPTGGNQRSGRRAEATGAPPHGPAAAMLRELAVIVALAVLVALVAYALGYLTGRFIF
jgi:hypothetical protein